MRYIEIENQATNERVVIDTYMSRYKRISCGFLNNLRINPGFVKHLTLTQREESYKPNILNSFFVQLRRFYGDVSYIWTAEIQEQRAEKYGDRVLHWHCIVSFSAETEFGREDVLRLQKYWKYGNLDIRPVRKPSVAYLMKYITKSLDIDVGAQIRRIGSSRIPAYLRMSYKRLMSFFDWMYAHSVSFLDLPLFSWSYKGARQVFGSGRDRQTVWIYRHPPSSWSRVREFDFDSI